MLFWNIHHQHSRTGIPLRFRGSMNLSHRSRVHTREDPVNCPSQEGGLQHPEATFLSLTSPIL